MLYSQSDPEPFKQCIFHRPLLPALALKLCFAQHATAELVEGLQNQRTVLYSID